MEVIVDKEACVGCGICADKCPAFFELEGGLAVVKAMPGKNDEAACRDAAESCPVNAIAIKE